MKSRVTIEVDFDNANTPVIQILQANSDDVRDKLIGQFLQSLDGSSWCTIRWAESPYEPNAPFRILITPITPEGLKEQAEVMVEQYRLHKANLVKRISG